MVITAENAVVWETIVTDCLDAVLTCIESQYGIIVFINSCCRRRLQVDEVCSVERIDLNIVVDDITACFMNCTGQVQVYAAAGSQWIVFTKECLVVVW